jgi:hypothetical protein
MIKTDGTKIEVRVSLSPPQNATLYCCCGQDLLGTSHTIHHYSYVRAPATRNGVSQATPRHHRGQEFHNHNDV